MAVVQLEPFDADIRKEELVNRFSITNLLDLGNPNPGVDSVKRVYAWIKNEPRCLTGTDKERLYQIRVLAKIRCWTEKHFANYAKVNIHSRHESEQVGAYLQKAEDDIRRRRQKNGGPNQEPLGKIKVLKSLKKVYVGTSGVGFELNPHSDNQPS